MPRSRINIAGMIASVVAEGIAPALVEGSAVVEGELFIRVPRGPRGPGFNQEFEPLEDTITTDIEVDKAAMTGVSSTGFGDSGPVALFNEYGHRIVTHSGKDTGEMTRENPVMRVSADACADAVMDQVAASLEKTLRRRF